MCRAGLRAALARPDARVVGVDLPGLEDEWAARTAANLAFSTERAFADDEFEVVTAIEVLEHVSEPERELAELGRLLGEDRLVAVGLVDAAGQLLGLETGDAPVELLLVGQVDAEAALGGV